MAAGFDLGSIFVTLKANTDQFTDALGKVEGKLGNFGKMADKFTGMAVKGVAAFGAAVIGASTIALKGAAEMQDLRTSFDVLTGSAQKGAEVFERLNKMGATTPFETQDLADATKTMLSFGISADKSMEYLKMLGDVSLGNKVKLSGLSLAFAQVQSTGRLMGQDLLQMINQGFNPLTILAEKTGKSMAVLKDEMAAGKISAQDVTEAFKIATSEGGLFFNGMDKGATTFNGRMATLQDTIGMTMRKMVGLSDTGEVVKGGLFDRVSILVIKLTDYLAENQDAIAEVASVIVDKLVAGLISTVEWITKVVKFFQEHQTLAKGLAVGLAALAVSLIAVSVAMKAIALWTAIMAGGWVGILIVAIGALAYAVYANWGKITGVFTRIKDVIVGFFGFLATGDLTGKFLRALGLEEDSPIIGGLVAFRDFFVAIFDAISGAWNSTISFIAGIPGAIASFFVESWESIKQWGIDVYNAIIEWIPRAINATVDFFAQLPERIAYWLGFTIGYIIRTLIELPGNLYDAGVAIVTFFVNTWILIWKTLIEWGTKTWDAFVDFVFSIPGRVSAAGVAIADFFTNLWKTVYTSVRDWVINTVNTVVSFFTGLPDRIKAFGNNLKSSASSTGQSIWDGFMDWLKGIPGRVTDIFNQAVQNIMNFGTNLYQKAKDLAGSFWKGFKEGLGIKSPSYVERAFMAISKQGNQTISDMKGAIDTMGTYANNASQIVSGMIGGEYSISAIANGTLLTSSPVGGFSVPAYSATADRGNFGQPTVGQIVFNGDITNTDDKTLDEIGRGLGQGFLQVINGAK